MLQHNKLDKLLHYLVLSSDIVPGIAYDLEKVFFDSKLNRKYSTYLITGLARAGTTALLNSFYKTKLFASLTYGDMPFVTSPNLWAAFKTLFLNGVYETSVERKHNDRIYIDNESPEALEEPFFNLVSPSVLGNQDRLRLSFMDHHMLREYRVFRGLVCRRYGKERYLAKNNNLIFRLGSLLLSEIDTFVIVVIRDPISHCISLLNQHRNFISCTPFEANYLKWLNHFDFGVTLKAFDSGLSTYQCQYTDPYTLNFWLGRWMDYYLCIYKYIHHRSVTIFSVNDYLSSQNYSIYFNSILNIPPLTGLRPILMPTTDAVKGVDQNLVYKASKLHQKFISIACMQINSDASQ